MDGSKEVESSADDPGARWLARYHTSQERLYRWSPHPLLAIRLRDDSMVSGTESGTDPWYPAGCTIVIDPRVDAQPGQRVVVEMTDGLCEFRELERYRGKLILKALNPAYAPIPLERWHKIRGVAVQVSIMTEAGKRREAEWAARQADQEATAA
jgi:phage repressor protein C with HTH and peptisase S24 domain